MFRVDACEPPGAVPADAPTPPVKRGAVLPLQPLMAAVTLGAVATMAVDTAHDPDVFWHLKTGQWIWAQRAVPRSDPLSWTAPGRKWIAHEWLTEAIYASLHRAFGWAGISVLSAVVIVTGWMLVRATCLRFGAGPIAATTATLLAAVSSLHTWGTRPQMLSLMFTAFFAWLLVGAVTRRPNQLAFAVPTMLLWANLHGGYIFGIAMLWACTVTIGGEYLLRRLAFGRRMLAWRTAAGPDASLLKAVSGTTFAATAVTLVNPNGIEGFTYPFSYLGKNASTKYVVEWFAPDFSHVQYWPFALTAGLFAFAIVRYRRTVPLHSLSIGLPFAFLAFQSVRNISQFAIIAAPVLALVFTRNNVRRATTQPGDLRATAIVCAMVGAALCVASAPKLTASANTRSQAAEFPSAAAKRLASMQNVKVFNQYDWGGYLLYAVPDLKVFIDGRPDMYGDEFVDRYMSTWWLKPGWKQRLADDGVNTVVANPGARLILELRKDTSWEQIYADPVAVILRHR